MFTPQHLSSTPCLLERENYTPKQVMICIARSSLYQKWSIPQKNPKCAKKIILYDTQVATIPWKTQLPFAAQDKNDKLVTNFSCIFGQRKFMTCALCFSLCHINHVLLF